MRTTLACLMTLAVSLMARPATPAAEPKPGPPGKTEFLECGKFPSGERVLKMKFTPEVQLRHLLSFMSTISCRPFFFAKDVSLDHKVRVLSPGLLTPEEAYDILIGALDSVGLTLRPSDKFLHIVSKPAAR